jgi:hypothetical protein
VLLSSFFPGEVTPSAFSADGIRWVGFPQDFYVSAYTEALGYVSILGGVNLSQDGRTWQPETIGPPSATFEPWRMAASGTTLLAYDVVPTDISSPELWAWVSE